MKQQIIITKQGDVLYKGRISDIPIRLGSIIQKSIELFDDDDPCIIHQSYVIKEYVNEILGVFKNQNNEPIELEKHPKLQSFLDIDDVTGCEIVLKG